MKREVKETTVDELKELLSRVSAMVITDFRGLKVQQINGLRSEIRKADCSYRVIKNTLFKRAIEGTAMAGLASYFKGPTAIAYSFVDPVAPAKVIDKFASTEDKLKVKGGFLDGKVLDQAAVKSLASMKGKDELRAELLALFIAPAQHFVALMAAAPQNFLYLLSAREREGGSAS